MSAYLCTSVLKVINSLPLLGWYLWRTSILRPHPLMIPTTAVIFELPTSYIAVECSIKVIWYPLLNQAHLAGAPGF